MKKLLALLLLSGIVGYTSSDTDSTTSTDTDKPLHKQVSEAATKLLTGPNKNIALYEACSKDFQRYMKPFLDLRAERLKLGDQSAAKDYYDNHLPMGNEIYLRCLRDGLRF